MAFKIQDLMVDLVPGTGGTAMWLTCNEGTMIKSQCPDPSCANCVPHSGCPAASRPGSPPPPKPDPDGVQAAPRGLVELRQQLRQTLAAEH
jgi:hypothetical protein